jgi:hypothetical protein
MSYMRGDIYAWVGEDGEGQEHMTINDVSMPLEQFDELVAMRHAEMTDEEKYDAEQRAVEKWGGNFGCNDLAAALGKPTAMDRVKEEISKVKKKDE